MGPVDLAEDLEETFTRVAAEGQARYPRDFKWPCIAKFRQLKESLKAMFSHHTISYNPPGLQLFVRNFCFMDWCCVTSCGCFRYMTACQIVLCVCV